MAVVSNTKGKIKLDGVLSSLNLLQHSSAIWSLPISNTSKAYIDFKRKETLIQEDVKMPRAGTGAPQKRKVGHRSGGLASAAAAKVPTSSNSITAAPLKHHFEMSGFGAPGGRPINSKPTP